MENKVIALGITGGIAAYKAADLCGKLAKKYDVRVLMTENATRFVTPLTFKTLSRHAVVTSLWEEAEWRPEHVALADDALTTFAATFAGKVLVAPAMNPKMWAHPACVENVATLKKRGVHFCGPVSGHVACGADGMGRMCEAAEILVAIEALLV